MFYRLCDSNSMVWVYDSKDYTYGSVSYDVFNEYEKTCGHMLDLRTIVFSNKSCVYIHTDKFSGLVDGIRTKYLAEGMLHSLYLDYDIIEGLIVKYSDTDTIVSRVSYRGSKWFILPYSGGLLVVSVRGKVCRIDVEKLYSIYSIPCTSSEFKRYVLSLNKKVMML